MWLIGYARVSKADGSQSLDLQRDALRAEGVDTSTSTTTSRPAYATTGPHVDAATPSGGNGARPYSQRERTSKNPVPRRRRGRTPME